jgi:hypothetical protein
VTLSDAPASRALRAQSLLWIVTASMKVVTVRNKLAGAVGWLVAGEAAHPGILRPDQLGGIAPSHLWVRSMLFSIRTNGGFTPPARRTPRPRSVSAGRRRRDGRRSAESGPGPSPVATFAGSPAGPRAQTLSHLSTIVVLAPHGEHFSVRLKFTAADKN